MAKTTVTAKSTKEELFTAYEATKEQLKAMEQTQLNPEKMKTQKRKTEVTQKVQGLSIESVSKGIDTVRTRAATVLAQVEQDMVAQLAELVTVNEALDARKAELKEIFGIETEAATLAALVEAQRERRSQFDEDLANKRAMFDTEQMNAKKAWEIERAEYLRTQGLRNETDQTARARELETSKYNFERDQKAKYDKLTDELGVRTKAFETDMEQRMKVYAGQIELLQKREALQKELETQVQTLTAAQAALQASIEVKLAAASEAAKKGAQVGYGIEVNALKKTHEAEVMVLKGQVDTLSSQLKEYREANVVLANKLEQAYAKVQSVAERALEAQGGRQALAAVQQAVETAGQKR